MMVNVKELLGENFGIEDAIFLRETIKSSGEQVVLDFEGFDRVPSTFLTSLFNDLINEQGRDVVYNNITVKNLTNTNDYSRVVMGTTFLN
ncbi:MAG: STAS-like domain-containing protein [Clostridium sp.]|uniref:STAS-like domain-containing protein n=1 Tax=Clostridium sp. TaxID=1506 RepID=UPI003F2BD3F8